MKIHFAVLSVAVAATGLLAPAARAQSQIYVCVDEDGRKTYVNTGATKNCKPIDVGPVVTVPAPKLPIRSAAPANSANSNGGNSLEPRADRGVTPASYPRVEAETQRSRDSDRRRILEDELRVEEDRLARLREEFNNGEPERRGDERNYARYQERVQRLQEDIQRGENNVVALRRELAALRQ